MSSGKYTTCSFCRTAISSSRVGALVALLWYVLCMLCNTTHIKTMSLTTFSLCSIVPNSTLNLLTDIPNTFSYPPASGDPVVCYSLFPCELSSAVGFHKPGHQGKGIVTQEKVVQIWPSLIQGAGSGSPKVPSSISFLNLLWVKLCASDDDPLDTTSTPVNIRINVLKWFKCYKTFLKPI